MEVQGRRARQTLLMRGKSIEAQVDPETVVVLIRGSKVVETRRPSNGAQGEVVQERGQRTFF